MGYCTKIFAVLATIMILSPQILMASRPLEGEKWLQKNLVVQSLRGAPVKGSQRNPCSTIPGRSRGRCTFQINVAGHAAFAHAPPAFPDEPVKFGAASMVNNDTLEHNSSPSSV